MKINKADGDAQKIQQNFTDAHRDELLKRDKLTGAERKKAQNDMAKDLVKETDRQGLMLEDVHKKVIGANQDLTDMSVEAQKQGEKIGNLGEQVIEMDQSVKKTGNTMGELILILVNLMKPNLMNPNPMKNLMIPNLILQVILLLLQLLLLME